MPDTATLTNELGFDPDELREKYRQERDRRIRPDGNDQYVEVKGDFARYVDDPYIDQSLDRAPLSDEMDVIIVGGGFGGLIAGAKMKEAGLKRVRLIEKGGDFGGTWYWNRYPGAACDIESYVYLPMLEETGYMPKRRYSDAPEIMAHSKRIAEHYDLYEHACLQTEVTAVRWDDAGGFWTVETNRGDAMRTQFLIMSNGPLNRPKLPGIPGVDTFKGHSFHTSRWDYDYTGGDVHGGLDRLSDKKVGIIGTGATAVQCVPHLAEGAEQLYVFQRTPSSIDVRGDRPTDEEWVASLKPGWHKDRMENFNILVSGGYVPNDLVNDGWTELMRNLVYLAQRDENKDLSPERLAHLMELADFKKMEDVRARADAEVNDPETAEALKPYYRQFCKRPCFHDDYLKAFNRANVTLVDTKGQGVDQITETSVIANGEEFEVDCLVFATGFEVGTDYTRRSGYEVYGKEGLSLTDAWADGVRSLHGLYVRDFPNLFVLGGAQGGFTASYPHNLQEQCEHAGYIISEMKRREVSQFDVTEQAEADWVGLIIEKAQLREAFLADCTPGYYNNEGKPAERTRQNTFYGGGSPEYFALLANWREAGDLNGLSLE